MIRTTLSSTLVLGAWLALAPARAAAQPEPLPFALAPTATPVTLTRDVTYGRADTVTLRMDVFRPAGAASARP